MAMCCGPAKGLLFALTALFVLASSVQAELTTEDTYIVGYQTDTITLPCEHTVAKSNLQSVVWRKEGVMTVAKYNKDDDPPVSIYGTMEGRASVMVFPSILKFSNGSLEDAGLYRCEVLPVNGDVNTHRYQLLVNAMPFNETIRLNGQSYQDCEKVYLSESTDALLSLSCTASSKPGSRLSWSADPATPALVVNQSIATECKTAANSIVTCERNATIVTKDLKDLVQVTCVTHFDDRRTVITSKRACVVLVPHGYRSPWVTVLVILLVFWLLGVVIVLIIIFFIWRLAKKENTAAPVDLRHLAIGLGLVLLPIIGVAVFIFLTFYWKLLPIPGKKAETEKSGEELGEQEGLREAGNNREEGTNKGEEQGDKEEETAAVENNREEQPMNSDPIDPDINTL